MLRKLRSTHQAYCAFRNWYTVVLNLFVRQVPRIPNWEFRAITRKGTIITIQPNDGSALAAFEVFGQDSYHFAELPLTRDGCVVLDIGANIGSFSLAALEANPKMRVVAFEPGELAFQRLKKNVEINRYQDRIICKNIAVVGNPATSEVSFFESTGGSIVSTTVEKNARGRGVWKKVPAQSLTAILSEYAKIDVLKIDIEGGEYEVFFNTDVRDLAPISTIVVEYHPATNHGWHELRDYFRKAGFALIDQDEAGRDFGVAWFSRTC